MAAPTIRQVMTALETLLDTIDGLRVAAYLPGQVTPPQASVGVPAINAYRGPFQRDLQLAPTITVLTSAASDRVGQLLLADYANPTGATSIIAAIETDPTLGGIVNSTYVESFTPLGLQDVAAIGYFGGVFQLLVVASH